VTGERATLRRPRELFLDEISVTAGFLGDLTTPNVFRRFRSARRSQLHAGARREADRAAP
jgi:hypothetical protein